MMILLICYNFKFMDRHNYFSALARGGLYSAVPLPATKGTPKSQNQFQPTTPSPENVSSQYYNLQTKENSQSRKNRSEKENEKATMSSGQKRKFN